VPASVDRDQRVEQVNGIAPDEVVAFHDPDSKQVSLDCRTDVDQLSKVRSVVGAR
jgi:hypothetical protein